MMRKSNALTRLATTGAVRVIGPLLVSLVLILPPGALAQDLSPLSYADSAPVTVLWPEPIRVTVHNNTTEQVVAIVQVTNLTDSQANTTLLANDLIRDMPPSVVLEPAGELDLKLSLEPTALPAPGVYTGHVVLSVPHRDAVIRKQVDLIVREHGALLLPAPAVETWTLNALRIAPFLNPVCLRGFSVGCTLPIEDPGALASARFSGPSEVLLGYLANERGGGVEVRLTGVTQTRTDQQEAAEIGTSAGRARITAPERLDPEPSPAAHARLSLAFDRGYGLIPRWGLTGTYRGELRFTETPAAGDNAGAVPGVNLVVTIKDVALWPILIIMLGVWAARGIQRHLTVHRDALDLLHRLDEASKQFGQLRKSVYGYTVGDSFLARRQELKARIEDWEAHHFGPPTPAERERFVRTVLEPLADFEAQIGIWATFRDKLDRLRRKMEYAAKPAIQQAEPPAGLTVEIKSGGLPYNPEPRFYTAARGLLQGGPMELADVAEVAERIDQAADIATVWGEYDEMVTLVRDALRQLYNPTVDLSPSEETLLDRARHHLNSAARDLWEARDLPELRERETRAELVEARDIVQRLLDPFVYYAGAEAGGTPVPAAVHAARPTDRAREAAGLAHDEGTALLDSLPAPVPAFVQPMVRSYGRLNESHLPGFDIKRTGSRVTKAGGASALTGTSTRTTFVGEQMVMGAALVVALIAGLNRYGTTQFGTFADYLTLFTWAFVIKVALELINWVISGPRWVHGQQEPGARRG